MLHQGDVTSPPYSILFPLSCKQSVEEPSSYTTTSSSSSSVVDCTLSLGTPSTRKTAPSPAVQRSFCWDMFSQSGNHVDVAGGGSSNGSSMGGDPLLLARRCANCDTTSTPLWRNGPRGPKSLCNACGIRYKKEERRAAASTPPPSAAPSVVTAAAYGYQRPGQHPWSCYAPTPPSAKAPSVYTDVDEDEPYLSWRLNVVPSLFQYQ